LEFSRLCPETSTKLFTFMNSAYEQSFSPGLTDAEQGFIRGLTGTLQRFIPGYRSKAELSLGPELTQLNKELSVQVHRNRTELTRVKI
jgi:hypothetical protein